MKYLKKILGRLIFVPIALILLIPSGVFTFLACVFSALAEWTEGANFKQSFNWWYTNYFVRRVSR